MRTLTAEQNRLFDEFEDVDHDHGEIAFACAKCHGQIFIACEFVPDEPDVNVSMGYICGLHADKQDTCNCRSDDELNAVVQLAEAYMLEALLNQEPIIDDW